MSFGELLTELFRKKLLPVETNILLKASKGKCIKCETTRPNYNIKGETKATHCAKCKTPDMINVKDPMCIKCEITIPNYNIKGETKATHCAKCKTPDMIDIKHPMCIKCEITQPNYNIKGEKKATHCAKCKTPDMIDIKNPMCIKCEITQPNYNLFGKSPKYCFRCKNPNMFIHPIRKCQYPKCKELASRGKSVNIRNHCEEHKEEDEIGFFDSECVSCNLKDVIVDDKNLCEVCDPDVFQKYKKRKQEEIKHLLKARNLDNYIGYDKAIESIFKEGCELKTRPDFLWDCKTHFLVLEVDENQHTSYECDKPRMINMSQAVGLPTIFVRYNPDNFKKNNKIVKITDNNRQTQLIEWIKHFKEVEYKLTGYCVYVELFYNDYNKSNVKNNIIQEFDLCLIK